MSKLEELENKLFMLQMQDTWTHEDYKYEDELLEQIKKLKRKEEKKMGKIKFYQRIEENRVKRVYEDEALPFALKDIQDKVKDEEFAQKFVDWYFKNWARAWEDVD